MFFGSFSDPHIFLPSSCIVGKAKALIVVSAVGINTPAVPQHSHKQISGRQSRGLAAPSVARAGLLGTLEGRVTVVEEEAEEWEQMLQWSSRSVW